MRRWLLNILAGLSLLIFVGIVTLWIRSYRLEDELICRAEVPADPRRIDWFGWSRLGVMEVCIRWTQTPRTDGLTGLFIEPGRAWTPQMVRDTKWYYGGRERWSRFMGFQFLREAWRGPGEVSWNIVVPYRAMTVATLLLPACWLIGAIRRRRKNRTGLCLVCGYDLRASHDRCPECGTEIPTDLVRRPLV